MKKTKTASIIVTIQRMCGDIVRVATSIQIDKTYNDQQVSNAVGEHIIENVIPRYDNILTWSYEHV